MGWKMSEKPKTVLASKSLVKEFAEMEPAPHDRPLSERRMQVYERILKAGEFRTVTWASALCAETNCVYRVNGKHTSLLLSRHDPVPEFHVTVERYVCDTLTDVANLYNTFDSQLGARTTKDVNLAFAATVPALKEIPDRLIHSSVTALAYLEWNEEELRRTSPAERSELLMEYSDIVVWLYSICGMFSNRPMSNSRHLMRAGAFTAMVATCRKAKKDATEFWTLVRNESHPNNTDPTRILARWLVRATLSGGRKGYNSEKKVVTFREMYVKCLHAWNAWRKGEATALNYHAKSPIPTIK